MSKERSKGAENYIAYVYYIRITKVYCVIYAVSSRKAGLQLPGHNRVGCVIRTPAAENTASAKPRAANWVSRHMKHVIIDNLILLYTIDIECSKFVLTDIAMIINIFTSLISNITNIKKKQNSKPNVCKVCSRESESVTKIRGRPLRQLGSITWLDIDIIKWTRPGVIEKWWYEGCYLDYAIDAIRSVYFW